MAEGFGANERCVHCLRRSECLTADHVVPSSWYPDTTPSTVQRWTAPSCPECNTSLGGVERDLLIRLALCVNPRSEAASGLAAKVFRTLGLDTEGLPEKEQAHRDKLRAKIRSELMPSADFAGKPGRIPGLGAPEDESVPWAIPIPWAGLSTVAEKIARGCEYKLRDRLVEPPYSVRTFVCDSDVVPEPYTSCARFFDFGPGCKVQRVFAIEDPNVVLYWMSIWASLQFRVEIHLEDELRKLDQRSSGVEGINRREILRAMRIPPYLRGQKET